MFIQVKLGNINLNNVVSVTWGANRSPNNRHALGQNAHNLDLITIRRNKALETKDEAKSESDVIDLASKVEKEAYFKGEILIKDHNRSTTTLQKIEWDKGHICNIQNLIMENGIEEVITIATTNLKVDNSTFELQPA